MYDYIQEGRGSFFIFKDKKPIFLILDRTLDAGCFVNDELHEALKKDG